MASSTEFQDATPSTMSIDLEQPILTLPQNVKVRMLRHTDATSLAKHANNPKIAQNMNTTWPEPYTEDSAHNFIAMIRKQDDWTPTTSGYPGSGVPEQGQKLPTAWAITVDDEPVGGIGCSFGKNAEMRTITLGYWLSEAYWGKGIVTQVVQAFVGWIWHTFPYIVRVEAVTYGWNPASGRVLVKSGWQLEGCLRASASKYGRVTDMFMYAVVRDGVDVTLQQPKLAS